MKFKSRSTTFYFLERRTLAHVSSRKIQQMQAASNSTYDYTFGYFRLVAQVIVCMTYETSR
jgi:hypothetical protein